MKRRPMSSFRWTQVLLAGGVSLAMLTVAAAPPAEAAFPGANGKLVQDGQAGNGLVTVNADGTGATQLNAPPGLGPFCCFNGAWSADGQEIAFVGGEELTLFTIDVATQVIERVDGVEVGGTPIIGGLFGFGDPAAWSPSGNSIVFSRELGGTFTARIWRVDRDASGWQVGADGSGLVQLTDAAGAEGVGDYEPVWAITPVGERIVFSTFRHAPSDTNGATREIYVMDANGAGETRLTNNQGAIVDCGFGVICETGGIDDHNPDWSPDGSSIAWQRVTATGASEIWVMGQNGTNQRRVADGTFHFWSPEGRIIGEDASAFFAIDATGLNRTALAGFPGGTDWGPIPLVTPPDPDECTITGTAGNDVLMGTDSANVICGLEGNDRTNGLGGNDLLQGDGGNDRLRDVSGIDTLEGGPGNDVLWARDGSGGDTLDGGSGHDVCRGDPGDTLLNC